MPRCLVSARADTLAAARLYTSDTRYFFVTLVSLLPIFIPPDMEAELSWEE